MTMPMDDGTTTPQALPGHGSNIVCAIDGGRRILSGDRIPAVLRARARISAACAAMAGAIAVLFLACGLARAAEPARLHVITDDNYPPFLFRADDGSPTGYLVDYWKLWESKTGVPVTLTATQWEQAQRRVLAGDADVIDMIFRTPAREPLYEFTEPYADLPVNLYTHKDILGIAGVEALRGLRIGVQAGDACVEQLQRQGLKSLVLYPSYAELIAAARLRDIRLFCLDEHPAEFYLHKAGIRDEFRKAFTLYTGQFHRAVPKGRAGTLRLLERGAASISDAERRALADKWFGEAIPVRVDPGRLLPIAAAVAAAGLAAMALLWTLRRQVAARTSDLGRANKALQL
ncbi:MAG: hypothetical protein RLZZ584_2724, partial [Pseudomonadota bacterium]